MSSITGKRGNHSRSRLFPGSKGKRPDNKKAKQQEALVRQEEYNKLTTEQKIEKLDNKLGKNIGAKKQRARLLDLLNIKQSVKVELNNTTVLLTEEEPKNPSKNKVKAKDRRKMEKRNTE